MSVPSCPGAPMVSEPVVETPPVDARVSVLPWATSIIGLAADDQAGVQREGLGNAQRAVVERDGVGADGRRAVDDQRAVLGNLCDAGQGVCVVDRERPAAEIHDLARTRHRIGDRHVVAAVEAGNAVDRDIAADRTVVRAVADVQACGGVDNGAAGIGVRAGKCDDAKGMDEMFPVTSPVNVPPDKSSCASAWEFVTVPAPSSS